MNYADLKTLVAKRYDGGAKSYDLKAADFGSDSVAGLLNDYVRPAAEPTPYELVLTNSDGPKVDDDKCTVEIPGETSLIAGPGTATSLLFFSPDGSGNEMELILGVSLPDGWLFTSRYAGLGESILADLPTAASSRFVYASCPVSRSNDPGYVLGLNFDGVFKQGSGYVCDVLQLISSKQADLGAVGPIVEHAGADPTIDLAIPVATPFGGGLFPGKTLDVTLALKTVSDAGNPTNVVLAVEASSGLAPDFVLTAAVDATEYDTLLLDAESESGIAFPGPGEVTKWIGGDGSQVVNSLPAEYRELSAVRLMGIQASVNIASPSVEYVNFSLGTAQKSWRLFEDRIEVSDLSGDVLVDLSDGVDVGLAAGSQLDLLANGSSCVSMDVALTNAANETWLMANLADGSSVDIEKIAKVFIPGAGDLHLPAVHGMALNFRASPTPHLWGIKLFATEDNPAPVARFPFFEDIVLSELDFELGDVGDGTTGTISGQIEVGGVTTSASYDIDGEFSLETDFQQFDVSPAAISKSLSGQDWNLPSWLERTLTFEQTHLSIHGSKRSNGLALALSTKSSFGKDIEAFFAFSVDSFSGSFGFVAGAALTTDKSLAEIFAGLPDFFGGISVTRTAVILSSVKDANYDISSELLKGHDVSNADFGIVKGAMFFSSMDISNASFAYIVRLFAKGKSDADSLTFLTYLKLGAAAADCALTIRLGGPFDIIPNVASLDHLDFTVGNLTAAEFNGPGVSLDGKGTFRYAKDKPALTIEAKVKVEIGSQVDFELSIIGKIPNVFGLPMDIDGLFVNVSPTEGSIGIGGVADFKSDKGDVPVGVYFMFGPEYPIAIAGCYSKPLSLGEIHNAMCAAGDYVEADSVLNSIKFEYFTLIAALEDLPEDQLKYICKQDKADPQAYKRGVFLRAKVTFFGWAVEITNVEVHDKQITGRIRVDPMAFHGFQLSKSKSDKSHGPMMAFDTSAPSLTFEGYTQFYVGRKKIFAIGTTAKASAKGIHYTFSFELLWGLSLNAYLDLGSDGFYTGLTIDKRRTILGHTVSVGGHFGIGVSRSGASVCVYVRCITRHKYVLVETPKNECKKHLSDSDVVRIESDDDDWRKEIEEQANADIHEYLYSLTPDGYEEIYNKGGADNDDELFFADCLSVIPKALKIFANAPVLTAADAIKRLEPEEYAQLDVSELAEKLHHCEHHDFDPDPEIYSPKDALPAAVTHFPNTDCDVATRTIKETLKVDGDEAAKVYAKLAAEILYQEWKPLEREHLYTTTEIRPALIDVYGISESDADDIIRGLNG